MANNQLKKFEIELSRRLNLQNKDKYFKKISKNWLNESHKLKYTYNFSWLNIPIIQYPSDMIGIQEIIMNTKPDLIIETGIAHGGSLVYHASLLNLLSIIDKKKRKVIGVDIEIRKHNLKRLKKHFLYKDLVLLEGSSLDKIIQNKVKKISKKFKKIMVILDSNHSSNHVFNELNYYSKLVSKGCYCIVYDTIVEFLPKKYLGQKKWSKGDSPLTAVNSFLKKNKKFICDKQIEKKLIITSAYGGFLKKV